MQGVHPGWSESRSPWSGGAGEAPSGPRVLASIQAHPSLKRTVRPGEALDLSKILSCPMAGQERLIGAPTIDIISFNSQNSPGSRTHFMAQESVSGKPKNSLVAACGFEPSPSALETHW